MSITTTIRPSPRFLVTVEFVYELRLDDPLSEYRSGFEIRTRKRCTRIVVRTHAEKDQRVRTYDLIYLDQRPERNIALAIERRLAPLPGQGHGARRR